MRNTRPSSTHCKGGLTKLKRLDNLKPCNVCDVMFPMIYYAVGLEAGQGAVKHSHYSEQITWQSRRRSMWPAGDVFSLSITYHMHLFHTAKREIPHFIEHLLVCRHTLYPGVESEAQPHKTRLYGLLISLTPLFMWYFTPRWGRRAAASVRRRLTFDGIFCGRTNALFLACAERLAWKCAAGKPLRCRRGGFPLQSGSDGSQFSPRLVLDSFVDWTLVSTVLFILAHLVSFKSIAVLS